MKILLVAALVLGLNIVISALQLRIIPAPNSEGKLEREIEEGLRITCIAEATTTDPAMNWMAPNGEIVGANLDLYSRSVTRDGPNRLRLNFSPVKKGTDGTYKCNGRDSTGQTKSVSVTLAIFEGLSCTGCERYQFPVNNTDALIMCPIKGSPPPVVSWKMYRTSTTHIIDFEKERDRYTQTADGMIVKRITSKDDGIYTCTGEVESRGAVLEKEIIVVVAFKPKFTAKPRITGNPIVRGEATIVCEAEGKPAPQIQFYKMNRPNTPVTGENIVKDQAKGTLKMSHLKSDQSGDYKCVATNRAGSDEVVFNFQVIEPPTLAEYVNTTVDRGLDGNLTCYIKGMPKPTLQFQKEGERAPYINNVQQDHDKRIRVLEINNDPLGRAGLQLVISQTTPKDSANYTCIAKNTAGTYRFNGELRVRYKPEMDRTQRTAFHWLGAVRNLTCLADGEPLPIIFHWFHNGLKIEKANATYKIFNESRASWLQITTAKGDTNQEKWLFGQYSCNASNSVGSSSAVIELKQAVAPERPSFANVTRVTPTTVSIEAQPPKNYGLGGIPLRGYQVNYKKLDEKQNFWEKQDFPITQNILVRNLHANTQYSLRILAYNAVGPSNVGINIGITTLNERKPYPVEITSDPTSATSYSYMLQWEVPLSGGAAITRFIINYRSVNVVDTAQRGASYSGAWASIEVRSTSASRQRAVELQNLAENQNYEIYIQAHNAHGASEATEPYFVFRTLTQEEALDRAILGASTTVISAFLISISLLLSMIHVTN